MPRWLERASSAIAGGTAESPQPYELTCSCGSRYQGYRDGRAQELICDVCGEPLFVLPADVYPRPKPVKKKERSKRPPPVAVPRDGSAGIGLSKRLAASFEALRRGVHGIRLALISQVRGLFKPLRIVAALLLLVVVATIWGGLRAKARDRAELTLRDSVERGVQALDERDFETASAEFGAAVGALDVLGRDDGYARGVRQHFRESRAAGHLATLSLVEIAREAVEKHRDGDAVWDDYFRTHYGGQWVVIDTLVERPKSEGGSGATFVIHYPLTLGRTPLSLQLDSAVFDRLPLGKEPRRVIFAAQLGGCRLVQTPRPRWEMRLRGETAFLWTDAGLYAALGFESDDLDSAAETERLLEGQARIVGIEE